ncbi:MAG: SIMPL domain-containing protein [Solirubrobacteraceae bacterium]
MRVRIAAAVAVTSLLLAPAALADTNTPPTLSVDGSGTVWVTPDVASLSLSVARSAASSSAALSAMNRRVDAIVGAVRAEGVPASAVQTESIDVSSSTVREGPPRHSRRVKRYTASESLSVTSTVAIVGGVIDAATHAGADSIDGPDFSFSEPDAGVAAATTAAIADANRRANAAAAALGYQVTGVQSVNLDPGSGIVAPVSAPGASASPGSSSTTPTSIHPGAQEVDATVAVVFTIAPV